MMVRYNIHNSNDCVNIQMQFFNDIGLIVGSFFCKQALWTIFDFESGGCIVAMQQFHCKCGLNYGINLATGLPMEYGYAMQHILVQWCTKVQYCLYCSCSFLPKNAIYICILDVIFAQICFSKMKHFDFLFQQLILNL